MHDHPPVRQAGATLRIPAIDVARGVALLAMAIYHFTWDLEFFGYVDPGMTAVGGWKLFARSIASSFLFLVGISLLLAHGGGIRWPSFLRRFAMVAGAAALISAVTFFAMPEAFIFFGILHQIALASVLGLLFLRVPVPVSLAAAAFVIVAPQWLRSGMFDHPLLWWVGLSTHDPRSNDYVPLFPWFGAVLAGMAASRFLARVGVWKRLAGRATPAPLRPLAFAGRHSLAFYLLHQPLLIGAVWLAAEVAPPEPTPQPVRFSKACEMSCAQTRPATFCAAYCLCMLDRLQTVHALDDIFDDAKAGALRPGIETMALACTTETEGLPGGPAE